LWIGFTGQQPVKLCENVEDVKFLSEDARTWARETSTSSSCKLKNRINPPPGDGNTWTNMKTMLEGMKKLVM
jgi:hypothetical protein